MSWYYEINHAIEGKEWESGFESSDDAMDAMDEAMTAMIDRIAEKHPDMTDEEIEAEIDWEVREE